MARPEHLTCINTPEGIRRINEMQDAYDRDPERWEREEQEARVLREQDEMRMQKEMEEGLHYKTENEMKSEWRKIKIGDFIEVEINGNSEIALCTDVDYYAYGNYKGILTKKKERHNLLEFPESHPIQPQPILLRIIGDSFEFINENRK
jgi:hypothetical protein